MLYQPLVYLLIPVALLPSILTFLKRHPHVIWISLVNLVGGPLFGLGWVAALIWCCVDPSPPRAALADEVERLHRLLQAGALTQSEFEAGKRALLHC